MQQGYLSQDLANWEIKGKGGNQKLNFPRHRPKKKQILPLSVTDGLSKTTDCTSWEINLGPANDKIVNWGTVNWEG